MSIKADAAIWDKGKVCPSERAHGNDPAHTEAQAWATERMEARTQAVPPKHANQNPAK